MSLVKRGNKWYVRLRQNRKDIWRSTGTQNKKLAEQREAQLKLEMAQNRFGLMDEGNKKMFMELMDKYMTKYAVKKAQRSIIRDNSSLKHLLPVFGNIYLSQISPNMISNYKAQRRQEGAASVSVNHELTLAKHAFNLAIKEWEWVRDNPFARVGMEKLPQPRLRYLTEDEYQALINSCDVWLRPIVITAVYTGMRKSNIRELKWQDVDLSRNLIILEYTKNGERLGMPMNAIVKELFKELGKVRHINSGYVFTNEDGTMVKETKLQKHFRQACKKAGITDFRFHDLRHTFASWLAQSGANLYEVQRLMGHKDFRMTQRYAHLAPDNLRDAVKRLENKVCSKNGSSEVQTDATI